VSEGLFITLEGIEGAGKSTLSRMVRDKLRARGVRVVMTREPGGTPLAERMRQIVLDRGDEHMTPQAETLLMFAARSVHLDNLIRPALARGDWVVCDRFTDATRAYQGGGRGVSRQWIEQLAGQIHGNLSPHCTLLLDLPVATGLDRAKVRAGDAAADRFESEREPFFERVRATYLELARAEPKRMRIIDAAVALPEVEKQVDAVLQTLLAERSPSS
jgi:dTMP kinase